MNRPQFPQPRAVWCARFALLSLLLIAGGTAAVIAQDPAPTPNKKASAPEKKAPATEQKTSAASEPAAKPIKLDDFPKGWKFFTTEPGVDVNQIWKVVRPGEGQDEFLQCIGKPYGYLRSDTKYENFEFRFEWRFPADPNGNSGVLVFTGDEDKIWPKSIQVQLHGPTTGSIFPLGDAMSANNLQLKDNMFAAGQWHRCTIRGEGGTISVTINGVKLGEVTGCVPHAGSIALQCEGSEVHFRKIWIRNLKPATADTSPKKSDPSVSDSDGEKKSSGS